MSVLGARTLLVVRYPDSVYLPQATACSVVSSLVFSVTFLQKEASGAHCWSCRSFFATRHKIKTWGVHHP